MGFGNVLFVLLCGWVPFDAAEVGELREMTVRGERTRFRWEFSRGGYIIGINCLLPKI